MRTLSAFRPLTLGVITLVLSSLSFAACPCTLFGNNRVPGAQSSSETAALELGVQFSSTVNGYVTGVRFFKLAGNNGTHVGNLWSANGTLLATATFNVEAPTGWQQVNFPTPVAITANTTYVASYHTNTGSFPFDYNFFANPYSNLPLQTPTNAGVFVYNAASAFPSSSYASGSYWVDVVFNTTLGPDTTPPFVVSTNPGPSGTGVSLQPTLAAVFNEPLNPSTVTSNTFRLLDPSGSGVAATALYSSSSRTATLLPSVPLANSTTYQAVLKSSITDVSGNALGNDYSWSFTTAAAYNRGPGGPILLVTSSSYPFSSYYAEILRTEGLNEFAVLDVSELTSAVITQYEIVIVGDIPLSASAVTILTNWVNGGGFLIAMHPDKQLAGLLGLRDAANTLANAYLLVNTGAGPGVGIVGTPIQFHGSADLYTLNGATAVATLYSGLATSTPNPAVTLSAVGNGAAAAFTYDLAKSVAQTRQGNPAWSGQARDGLSPRRSDDLFYGAASFDPEPDWVDFNNITIPQADEQQRLLANLIVSLAFFKQPLPRFWYFPNGVPAVVIMTGDDHANGGTTGRFDKQIANSPPGCSLDNWQCVRSTSYAYPNTPISASQLASYSGLGFEVSIHALNGGIDYTSFADLDRWYVDMLTQFVTAYPGAAWPSTERTHCVVFSDYDTQPKVQASHQIRLDSNYYYYPQTWVQNRPGYFTGSGMPMRFTALDGSIIDVYQAPTQMTDESGQTYPDTVIALLNLATGPLGFYAAFNTSMHTDFAASSEADSIVSVAQSHGVPLVSALQMLRWLDGRNTSSFGSFNWNGYILAFSETSGAGANGIVAMLPTQNAVGSLAGITLSGASVSYSTQTIKGVSYALFSPVSGGNYQATYSGLAFLSFSPSVVIGGGPSTGTVTLNGPAPSGGAKVTLSSGNPSVTVPASVNVAAGATSATFTATTKSVSNSTVVTLTGSYGGVSMGSTLTVSPSGGQPTLVFLAVTPANPTIAINATQPFTATGTYSDTSTQDLTSQVTWASSNTGKATITSAGVATGKASGTSTISATLNGISGNTMLTVSPATLVSIAVTPANPTIAINATQPFMATGTYSDTSTQNLTAQVTWASSNVATATITSAGVATGKAAGTSTISATLNSISGSTTLTVSPATLVSIAVTPANPNVTAGSAQQFKATGTYSDNSTQDITSQVTWTSSSTSIATINAAGLASAKTAGTSTIAGAMNSISGNTVLTVQAAPPPNSTYSLWNSTTTPAIVDGGPDSAAELGVKFTADAAGTITGVRFYKASTNSGTHVGNLWSSTGQLLATATFTSETASGWQQVNFSSPVNITANTVYVASYHANVGHYSFDWNYFANALNNSPLHAPSSASSGGNAVFSYGITSVFPSSTYAAGNYWVDVVFSPSSGTASLVSIAVTPANPAIAINATQPFTATGTYSDSSTQNLTSQVTWASSNTATATISSAGVATGKAAGTSTISATLNSISGSTTLTVSPATLVSIAVTPANPTIAAGTTQPFKATGTYTDNSTQDITGAVTWSSSQTSVATISTGGLASSVAAGATTITAALGTTSGATTLKVTASGGGISFLNGFSSTGLALNGNAAINQNVVPNRLRLTHRTTGEAGSAWFTVPQNIQSFTNDFTFQTTGGTLTGAGFTFVIQNTGTKALGPAGGGLGYGPDNPINPSPSPNTPIANSVAVKFDLSDNAGEGTNSTGIYTNGSSPTVPATSLVGVDLHSGQVMKAHMTYDGSKLTMTITDTANAKTFTLMWPINIPAVVGSNTAYLGFTGGTSSQTAVQEITTWNFTNTLTTPVTYQTTKLSAVTSGPALQPLTYSGFPDGTGTLLAATKTGNSVSYTVNLATTGTYDVRVSYEALNTYGKWQLAINGMNLGPVVDEYQASAAYAVADVGNFTFSSPGNYTFTFTVTGKNASSSGFKISFDDFTLTSQ